MEPAQPARIFGLRAGVAVGRVLPLAQPVAVAVVGAARLLRVSAGLAQMLPGVLLRVQLQRPARAAKEPKALLPAVAETQNTVAGAGVAPQTPAARHRAIMAAARFMVRAAVVRGVDCRLAQPAKPEVREARARDTPPVVALRAALPVQPAALALRVEQP